MDVGLVDSSVDSFIGPCMELLLEDEWFLLIDMWSCMNVSKYACPHCGEPVIKIGHYPISEDISKGGTYNHKPASHIIHISVKTFL